MWANGFFKAVGFNPITTDPYTAALYSLPTSYFGTCLAPVTVQASVKREGATDYGFPITVSVVVALDQLNATGTPPASPTGNITISAQGDHCTATLTQTSATSATASCDITPLMSGLAVPVQVIYPGDTSYAAATGSTTVSVKASPFSLFGHQVEVDTAYPDEQTLSTVPVTVTVGSGVEVSSGQLLDTQSGLRIIGSTVDFAGTSITVLYNEEAQGATSSFNGWIFNFDASTPTIASCTLSPNSTVDRSHITVGCSAHQVTINESGLYTHVGDTELVVLTFAAP